MFAAIAASVDIVLGYMVSEQTGVGYIDIVVFGVGVGVGVVIANIITVFSFQAQFSCKTWLVINWFVLVAFVFKMQLLFHWHFDYL